VTEATYACGSSRGKVLNGSYHFVGLRIHPGPGNELADGNPGGNHQSFIELVSYKLQLLQASVEASKNTLPKLQYQALKERLDGAVAAHNKRDYVRALLKIQLFLRAVEHSDYKPIVGKNFEGEHVMRGSNIEFIYEEKILPFG
jgi:hypothetical protein